MTIMPPRPHNFACAICNRDAPGQWEYAAHRSIPPICRTCEDRWGTGPHNLNRDVRTIKIISALAEALTAEAYRAQHNMEPVYGRA